MHVFVLVLVLLDPDWVFHLELGLSIAALGASAVVLSDAHHDSHCGVHKLLVVTTSI
jgi:hypothetical protein